jgi:hypothetical protein
MFGHNFGCFLTTGGDAAREKIVGKLYVMKRSPQQAQYFACAGSGNKYAQTAQV